MVQNGSRTGSDQGTVPHGPLSHIKVIDVSAHRAGPACVRILADMGADVIQVTRPVDAAADSHLPPFDMANLHRNKRSVALNLQDPEGHAVFLRMIRDADVLVENYRPDVKNRLKIDYASLAKVNERLVYGSISGFGQDGPYANRPGVDQIAQGMGGLMSITGEPGTGPWRVGIAISDLCAGMFLAHAIMGALIERDQSGKGQWVHTSLLEAMVAMLDFQATRWLINGEVPPQAGNDHPTIFPMGVFETADGHINIAATGDRMWRDFLRVLELDELAADDRFKTSTVRSLNRGELREISQEKLVQQGNDYWVEKLNQAGVPCGPILSIDQVFANPQIQHLGMSQPVRGEDGSKQDLVRAPMSLSRTPTSLRRPAPHDGEHTLEVLREFGYSEADLAAMASKGLFGKLEGGAAG